MRALLLPVLLGLMASTGVVAQTAADNGPAQPPLPDPLTLEAALDIADKVHPDVMLSAARLADAGANLLKVRSDSDATLSLSAQLRAVEPVEGLGDPSNNDSLAELSLHKRLYDFGYSEAREQAALQGLQGAEWSYLSARQQHRLAVMRAFFDVILADLLYARDNEEIAVAYIAFNKAQDKQPLGMVSDIELLRLESEFQTVRVRWTRSQTRQRLTRTRLAQLLNRPDDPPANLVMPDEPDFSAKLPEVDQLQQQALADNPKLKALRAKVEAALQGMTAARKAYGPVIRGEVKAGAYNREMGSRYPVQAGLVFEMPLFTGRAGDAAIAKARAELAARRAELAAAELAVRQGVLDSRLGLDDVKANMEQMNVLGDYQDLYLDRSRALYQMEVRTDLGDAMVKMSTVRLQRAEVLFNGLLAQARLAALTGRLIKDKMQEDKAP
jgi:outer membrane protein TolC